MIDNGRIPVAQPVIGDEEIANVMECLKTNWISSQGRFITEFERSFANRIGVRHGIAVSTGTAALHLALATLGVEAGDEVIVPTLTMISCANAIRYTGARPALVDSDPETGTIAPAKLSNSLSSRSKAIMPVHLYGHPADMAPIREFAKEHDLRVVEDAAEAHGAEYNGVPVGGLSDFGVFSFYANKIVTCGEGGMLVTNDDILAEKARSLRNQAYDLTRRKWLVHTAIGFNYRLTNVQAAIGAAQTAKMDFFINRHRRGASLYAKLLSDLPEVRLPDERPGSKCVYWMYNVRLNSKTSPVSRDGLMARLEKDGIETRAAFWPIHQQPPYLSDFRGLSYPSAEAFSQESLNLPLGNDTTEDQIVRVSASIHRILRP